MNKEAPKTSRKPETWADTTQKITTIKGEEIEYPTKTAIGKELKIREIFFEKLSPFMNLLVNQKGKDLEEKAFPFFLHTYPSILPSVTAVVIEKDEKWVLENIDKETCEGIVNPFFRNYFNLSQIQDMLPKEVLQEFQK